MTTHHRPLVDVGLHVRPLAKYPKAETAWSDRQSGAAFKADLDDSTRRLRYELDRLGVLRAVLELDYAPSDIRVQDGWPRSDRTAKSPRVVLRFDLPGVGAMVYACDTFERWQINVRAIALGLEALRTIDRYGITTTNREQYRGFTALPSGRAGATETMTAAEAARVLLTWDPNMTHVDDTVRDAMEAAMLGSPELTAQVARRALGAVHPDAGGKADDFHTATLARDILTAHHGGSL